jgi:type III secretion protein L
VHRELVERSERDIVSLALRVAERIIGRDLERDPALLADICAAAIENVRRSHQVIVRVHPQDAGILRELSTQIIERSGRVNGVVFKEDADVSRFGCVIESDVGVIDAQLATQFEMLREVLLGKAAKGEGEN